MKTLTWNQVNAWRLAQHGLLPRLPNKALVETTSRLFGIHAQVMSAAELALGVRTDDISPDDVQSALWEERSLVKTWAMRGTLHLLAADDLPLHATARRIDPRGWIDFESHGISEKDREKFIEAVPEILSDQVMTLEELGAAVTEQIGLPALGDLIGKSNWGTPLKFFAFRGDLCFGPNQGKHVTFVNAKKWIGKWEPVEPEAAFQEIARRYLRAYGPLTPRMFARWWNEGGVTTAEKLFKQIEDEIEPVDVEGWEAVALSSTIEAIQASSVSDVVRLLPMFDAYVLDIARMGEPVLSKDYWKRVFRQQGWTTAVVLVDGMVKGLWDYQSNGAQTRITVEMLEAATKPIQNGIEAEAARIGEFLNTAVDVQYGSIK